MKLKINQILTEDEMKTFTAYQSTVLKIVETTERAVIYTRYHWFETSKVINIIANGWRLDLAFTNTAALVVAYIQKLQK